MNCGNRRRHHRSCLVAALLLLAGCAARQPAPDSTTWQPDEATRTARRAKEGQTDSITARDQMDTRRKTAPLICPDGAIRIDTAPYSLEEVIAKITRLIQA